MKVRVIYLEITSWVGTGAIGAQHYYGKLVWKRVKPQDFHHNHEFELRRLMTTKEIKEANSERIAEGFTECLIENGETTRGFANEQEVIQAGVATCAKLFTKGSYLLIRGEHGCCSAMPVLAWPTKFSAQGKRMNKLGVEWDRIGGYGYTWSKKDPERDKKAEALDEEWQQLYEQIIGSRL